MNTTPRFDTTWISEMKRLEQAWNIDSQDRRRIGQICEWTLRSGYSVPLLKHLNVVKGISHTSIATAVGVSRTAVVHWCAGREAPTIENLERLKDAFVNERSGWIPPRREDLALTARIQAVKHLLKRQAAAAIVDEEIVVSRLKRIQEFCANPFSEEARAVISRDGSDGLLEEAYLIVTYCTKNARVWSEFND